MDKGFAGDTAGETRQGQWEDQSHRVSVPRGMQTQLPVALKTPSLCVGPLLRQAVLSSVGPAAALLKREGQHSHSTGVQSPDAFLRERQTGLQD